MTDPETRAKKRATSGEPSTPSANKKAKKRTPKQQAAAAEAQRQHEANRAAKLRRRADNPTSTSKARQHPNTDEGPATPTTARDLKGELASPETNAANDQRMDLKEAPSTTEASSKEALGEQMPIKVVESSPLPGMTAFGKNTVESLESAGRDRALANEVATYGRGKYEAALKEKLEYKEIDDYDEDREEEEFQREEEEEDLRLFGQACLGLELFVGDANIDHARCKVLWGRDGAIDFEAYKKLGIQDEERRQRRIDKAKLRKQLKGLDSPKPPLPIPPPPPPRTTPLPEGTVPLPAALKKATSPHS